MKFSHNWHQVSSTFIRKMSSTRRRRPLTLIQCGIDPEEKSSNGCNALHFLCANNSSQLLTETNLLLIDLGIDVNGKKQQRK